MQHVIIHQASNYTQNIYYNILKDWVTHNTTSEYMERDGCMKAMMHFKNVCGENKLNPQVLLYDGHGSHFDDRVVHILLSHHIKQFILKADDSGNSHPNDDVPKLNLKGLYVQAIMNWQIQHGTLKFKNVHMNAVLVETWRYFHISSSPIITNAFN